jgi:hypothetical protein
VEDEEGKESGEERNGGSTREEVKQGGESEARRQEVPNDDLTNNSYKSRSHHHKHYSLFGLGLGLGLAPTQFYHFSP